MKQVFLYPGQYLVGGSDHIIKTVLGSCVAVIFWDRRRQVGGMCHFLLAEAPPGAAMTGRYGCFAVDLLFKEMLSQGAEPDDIVGSIYGGGSVVDALSRGGAAIGVRNIQCAVEELKKRSIKVVENQTGGNEGRRIALDVATGQVRCETNQSSEGGVGRSGVVMPQLKSKTKVLIVDDSATIRTILKSVFDKSKNIEVVGTAVDPFDARDKIVALKPDVITLDIEMPRMNGIQFLEKLMAHHPMPVIVVSSLAAQGAAAERALQLGAVDFIHKPSQFDPMILSDLAETLIPKVIGAASVDLTKAKVQQRSTQAVPIEKPKSAPVRPDALVQLITIAGNAGAPSALAEMLKALPADTPPIVVAIPTIAGFAEAWIEKNGSGCRVDLKVAAIGKPLRSGTVSVWAADCHVRIVKHAGYFMLEESKGMAVSGQRPSADVLFESLATSAGSGGIAVLLSGYGNDGVAGLNQVQNFGGWTICQSPSDCTFNFNVVAAIEAGVVSEVSTRGELAGGIYQRRSNILAS